MSTSIHNQLHMQKASSSATHATQLRGAGPSGVRYPDNRPGTVAQLKLRNAMLNAGVVQMKSSEPQSGLCTPSAPFQGEDVVQRYSYGPATNRNVTVTGKNAKSVTFQECTSNSVTYKKGEKKSDQGSITSNPASWAKWLTNKKGGRNATQLHVVNARWGGKGGQNDGNIVPGTPAENSHHLHQAEVEFDECFDAQDKAKEDCVYECTATPKYGTAVNVAAGNVDYGDPTLDVNITYNGVKTNHPVVDGSDGLTFKDGG